MSKWMHNSYEAWKQLSNQLFFFLNGACDVWEAVIDIEEYAEYNMLSQISRIKFKKENSSDLLC